jgi:trk system potassium uptake protein TrkA
MLRARAVVPIRRGGIAMIWTRSNGGERVIVIGLGRFGRSVALTLHELGYGVTGVDIDEKTVADLADSIALAVQGDGADEELLQSLQVDRCIAAIVGQGRSIESGLLTTLHLKRLGVQHVVAKATSAVYGDLLLRVGADRVVFPERDAGVRLAHSLVVPSIDDYISLSGSAGVAKFVAPAVFIGRSLADLHDLTKARISVLMIKRGAVMISSPALSERVQAGDELVVAGPDRDIETFVEAAVDDDRA